MSFKRHVRKVYPIAGIRWVDKSGVSSSDGLLFNVMRIGSDNNRRLIADEQYLIQWDTLVSRISDDLGIPVTDGSNLGGATNVFSAKVGTELQFKSLLGGTNVTLTDTGTEIVINSAGGGGGGGDVIAVPTPVADQVAIWTGSNTIKGGTILTTTGTTFTVAGNVVSTGGVSQVQDLILNGITSDVDFPTSRLVSRDLAGNVDLLQASGGGTVTFLRADGAWAAPPAGGGATPLVAVETFVDNSTGGVDVGGGGNPMVITESFNVTNLNAFESLLGVSYSFSGKAVGVFALPWADIHAEIYIDAALVYSGGVLSINNDTLNKKTNSGTYNQTIAASTSVNIEVRIRSVSSFDTINVTNRRFFVTIG